VRVTSNTTRMNVRSLSTTRLYYSKALNALYRRERPIFPPKHALRSYTADSNT